MLVINGNVQNCEFDNINLYPMKRTSWCLGALVASVTFFWVIRPLFLLCDSSVNLIFLRLQTRLALIGMDTGKCFSPVF